MVSGQLSKRARFIIYGMIACQLAVWGWFSSMGGELGDTAFLVFTGGMLLGQAGAAVETFVQRAWGTLVVQLYFFVFTTIGGIVRLSGM